MYKYIGINSNNFTKGKAYWVYSNQSGNLTLKAAGGSLSNGTYQIKNLMFKNSSGSVLNITGARTAGWIAGSSVNSIVYYWDEEVSDWGNVLLSQNFNAWQGYFMRANQENITMMRQN